MKKCDVCGIELDDKSVFCKECGTRTTANAMPQDSLKNTRYDFTKAPKQNTERMPLIFFNVLYSMILFTLLFPMLFPDFAFSGYGQYGYGARQQISMFNALMPSSGDMNMALMLLIQSCVILMIVAIVMASVFCVVSLVTVNRAKSKNIGLNFKLLKVYNSLIFFSLVFVFLITVPYLTFTFMCSLILSFYVMLVTLRPNFADDFVSRKDNEGANSSAVSILMLSAMLVMCFSPIYGVEQGVEPAKYNFYNFILAGFGGNSMGMDGFFVGISICLFVLYIALFGFALVRYLMGKKPIMLAINCGVGLGLLLSVLIGAYMRIQIQLDNTGVSLGANYYILLSMMIVFLVLYLVQQVLDYRNRDEVKNKKESKERKESF